MVLKLVCLPGAIYVFNVYFGILSALKANGDEDRLILSFSKSWKRPSKDTKPMKYTKKLVLVCWLNSTQASERDW